MPCKRAAGFTLIEIMIVVAIVAILAAIAYPAYNRYGFRARRSDGQEFLLRVAAAEERYFTTYNTYTTSVTGSPNGLGFTGTSSNKGYYTVGVVLGAGGQSYTLTGTPQAGQSSDACANLILDSQTGKSASGSATNGACW